MKRISWWALLGGAIFFAVQGGEYSTRERYVLTGMNLAPTERVHAAPAQVDVP